jgi:integrase
MSNEYDQITLKNGRLLIYRRRDCGDHFHCRMRFRGRKGYVRKSLDTTDRDESIREGEKLFDDLNYKISKGLSVVGKKFNNVCDDYLKQIETQIEIESKKSKGKQVQLKKSNSLDKKLKDQSLICERYLKPYFGKKDLNKILNSDVTEYREWRNSYWITGKGSKLKYIEYERGGKTIRVEPRRKVPTSSTLNTEETVLRKIFQHGFSKGYISGNEIPTIKSERVKSNQRPHLTLEDYRTLTRKSWWRCKNSPDEKTRRQRLLLHNFILIMTNTGLRPVEGMTLRWRDISYHISPTSKKKHIVLSVRGKNKKRDLIGQPSVNTYIKRMKERQKEYSKEHGFKFTGKEEYVFSNEFGEPIKSFKGGFDSLLRDSDLEHDNHGGKRCIYSLRHTYGTFRLVYGNVDVFFLSENMGTSVEMIKKHYSHLKITQVSDHLTRVIKN